MDTQIDRRISNDYVLDGGGERLGDAELSVHLKDKIRERIKRDGIILLRNIGVQEPGQFKRLLDSIGARSMDYLYRSTPRTAVFPGVHTSTEYPPQLEIPLHCENSYQLRWPTLIAFCCLKVASGGRTTVSDMSTVTNSIGPELMEEISRRKIRYVRNYHPRMDLSWQEVFQTSDKLNLEEYCRSSSIDFKWLDRGVLRTEQVCQGAIPHPLTGKMVHFNQAHLFHPTSLGDDYYEDMVTLFGRDHLPRMAYFGDGGEIPDASLTTIRQAFQTNAQEIDWAPGVVAFIDNRRFAHGRRPYVGERRVLAALLNASDGADTLD